MDGGSFTAQVGSRNTQTGSVSFTSSQPPDARGRISIRNHSRYHRFRLDVSGEFNSVAGIEFGDRDISQGAER